MLRWSARLRAWIGENKVVIDELAFSLRSRAKVVPWLGEGVGRGLKIRDLLLLLAMYGGVGCHWSCVTTALGKFGVRKVNGGVFSGSL